MRVLEADRLLLRSFEITDADDIYKLASDWRIADTIPIIPHPYTLGDARQFISNVKDAEEQEKEIGFAIVRNSDGALVGQISLFLNKTHYRGTLGYWVGTEFWGHGYATEACERIMGFGFDELGLNRIQATAYSRNKASMRVLQKCGLKYEGTAKENLFARGVFEDVASFGLIKSESTDTSRWKN